ncbi:MAG: 1,4-dihydroxy-2-naphthoate octaprenyltransferase [Rhodocyclaceae bacterium]|nr:1,4-dihydroxy-2-naphthoate octaprenyltransferase [Rhodocyclaceae bacterium]
MSSRSGSRLDEAHHRVPGGLALWWLAVRPRTLTLAAVPVLVGTALALHLGAGLDVAAFLVALASALAIQAGTNLFNDAGDFLRGNDGPTRVGPLRVTAAGLATPGQVRRAAGLCFLAALAGGLFLALRGGWPIVAIGLASLAAGWAYSGGPRPLSHTAWGEVFVMGFFGVVAVAGSHYLQSGQLSAAALLLGVLVGAPAAAVLLVNNVRDLEADRLAGRRTLASVLGIGRARRLYGALVVLPPLAIPLVALAGVRWQALVPVLILLPLCVALARGFLRMPPGTAMNGQLARTARAQVLIGLVLAFGLVLA